MRTVNDKPDESRSTKEDSRSISGLGHVETSNRASPQQAANSLEEQVEKLAGHEFQLREQSFADTHRDSFDPSLTLHATRSEAWDALVSPLTYEQWEKIVTGCQERLREAADFEPKHAFTVQRAINSLDDCLRFICAHDLEGAESALMMASNSFRSIRALAQYQDRSSQTPEEEFAERTLHRALVEFESAIADMADYLLADESERSPVKLWGMWNSLSDGVMIIHAAQRMQDERATRLVPKFDLASLERSGRKAG